MTILKPILFLLLLLLFSGLKANNTPNIIVILADDQGVGDVSNYRRLHTSDIKIETPNIDVIVENGMMFTNAHAPAALCATSRYAIFTGNHNYRSPLPWGVWSGYAPGVYTDSTLTLGKLMKNAGYQTAFFGKWHMGTQFRSKSNPEKMYQLQGKKLNLNIDITEIAGDGPSQNGFDYNFTLPSGIQNEPYAVYENDHWYPLHEHSLIGIIDTAYYERLGYSFNKKVGLGDSKWDPRLIGPLLANKAVNYINEKANKKAPFFMYCCSQAVH